MSYQYVAVLYLASNLVKPDIHCTNHIRYSHYACY